MRFLIMNYKEFLSFYYRHNRKIKFIITVLGLIDACFSASGLSNGFTTYFTCLYSVIETIDKIVDQHIDVLAP